MSTARPRVVIVGAGMAGLSAAHRLHQAGGDAFDLTVLEGSHRIGGRIETAHLGGDQVELGATYIHGITGSPVYAIADRIGALSAAEGRFEHRDDKPGYPIFRAQGVHLPVDPCVVAPVMEMFRSSMEKVKRAGAGPPSSCSDASVGAFLEQTLCSFFQDRRRSSAMSDDCDEMRGLRDADFMESCVDREVGCHWNTLLLQESAFSRLEAKERCISACNSLYDLDLASLKEYTEYPGPHITIGKGYASILKELENGLSPGTVKLGKKVEKIFWNHSHPSIDAPVVLHCEDGSVVQAEHTILTMSLGVLKAAVSQSFRRKHSPLVCRSVQDLRDFNSSEEVCADEIFKPSLPSWKCSAISRLGFGLVNKLFLLLDPNTNKRLRDFMGFLHHKELEGVPRWLKKVHSMFPIAEGSNVVLCWMAGQEALEMEKLTDDEILEGVAQMLSSFGLADPDESIKLNRDSQTLDQTLEPKQRLRKMLRGVLRSNWGTNCLFQGSYSFVAVGSSGEDIDFLAKPLPDTDNMVTSMNSSGKFCTGPSVVSKFLTDKLSPLQLLFAGEATHRSFYSTTHGAFLSGVREADRLLKHYQKVS